MGSLRGRKRSEVIGEERECWGGGFLRRAG